MKILYAYYAHLPYYVIYSHVPRETRLKKMLSIQCYRRPIETPTGILQGPMSSYVAKHSVLFTTPEAGYYLTNNDASMYVSILFALTEKDVGMISTLFSTSVLAFFRQMEQTWEKLCDNIEYGTVDSDHNIPYEKLQSLQKILKPDPRRATYLRREFEKGFIGIARRVWPGVGAYCCISTGVFYPAADVLQSTYMDGLENFCRVYGGTEGIYGVNRNTFGIDVTYDLAILLNFYELLPVGGEETILPEEAVIGEKYELIITTSEGLYCYRTTDIIEVVGFVGTTLTYKFDQRMGDFLNLWNEKTPVSVIENVLRSNLRTMVPDVTIADYCCTESLNVDMATGQVSETRYWVFLELDGETRLPDDICEKVDKGLAALLPSYASHRDHGTASCIKVVRVATGTFSKLRSHILEQKVNTTFDQFKMPRITRDSKYIQIFMENMTDAL